MATLYSVIAEQCCIEVRKSQQPCCSGLLVPGAITVPDRAPSDLERYHTPHSELGTQNTSVPFESTVSQETLE